MAIVTRRVMNGKRDGLRDSAPDLTVAQPAAGGPCWIGCVRAEMPRAVAPAYDRASGGRRVILPPAAPRTILGSPSMTLPTQALQQIYLFKDLDADTLAVVAQAASTAVIDAG